MGGGGARRGGAARRVDARAMGIFLAALKRGTAIAAAAREAGFHAASFYRRREADPAFGEAWAEAVEIGNAPTFVAPQNGRRLQLRKSRRVRFNDTRRQVFLAHFAGTCDLKAAAEAAGVCTDTVNNHRRKDPEFAEACAAALEQGYRRLEEEAVRQRLEAQDKLRAGVVPAGEVSAEFERLMKLLAHWTRRNGRLGLPPPRRNGQGRSWTFDEAMTELARKLRALKIPVVGVEGVAVACAAGGLTSGAEEVRSPLHQPAPSALAGPPPPFDGAQDRRPGEDLG